MSSLTIGVIGIVCFVVLMLIGVHIPFSMLLVGFLGCVALRNPVAAMQILTGEMTGQFTSYALTVGALFGLMGFMANYTGLGEELYSVVNKFTGHLRGGLAMATQVACAFFGAICGSPPATIGAFSAIAYPEMKAKGYAPGFSGAAIASGAQISVLIPPSSLFIIYCMATDTSVGKQFIAGVVPGILLTLFNIAAIWLYLKFFRPQDAPLCAKVGWKERVRALASPCVIQILAVFLVSMGGLFAGLFTPSEAGAVGAFGMFIVTLLDRSINFKKFLDSCIAAVELHTMVVVLLACANIFSRFISLSGIPQVIGKFCQDLLAKGVSDKMLLLFIVLLFFFLGMLMDLISVMLITIPIFFPLITGTLGYDPLWYGVLITTLICLGGLTPPMGASIFMMRNACRDPDLTLQAAFKASIPYFFSFSAICLLLIFFPGLVTWLPNLFR